MISVVASSPSATTAKLTAWQQGSDGSWEVAYGPYTARVGSAGIGPASEYASRTPQGTFTLTEAFGRLANPGTALPYRKTQPDDWWVSDVKAKTYNTWQTCEKSRCAFNTGVSEPLYYIAPLYDYAVVLDVNQDPVVTGGGSAFFLHISNTKPTAGCVAVSRKNLVKLMQWLDPTQHPRVAIGVK